MPESIRYPLFNTKRVPESIRHPLFKTKKVAGVDQVPSVLDKMPPRLNPNCLKCRNATNPETQYRDTAIPPSGK